MNRRLITIILVALFMATAASYLVYTLVRARTSASDVAASGRVVVAAKDLELGALVHEADLTYANWVGTLPKGFSQSPKDFVDRGVIAPIYQGEPMTQNRLAAVGAGAGLAATIPPGMRACAVKVNDVVGVAGFVLPGMRVDVLITGGLPMPGTEFIRQRVRTLLQNIMVLSAGQNYHQDVEGKPVDVQVVNLLVTPDQAELLSLATSQMRIQLVLRNPLDSEIAKTAGTGMEDLVGDSQPKAEVAKPVAHKVATAPKPVAAPQPPPPAPPPALKVQVLNGAKHSESSFSNAEEKR